MRNKRRLPRGNGEDPPKGLGGPQWVGARLRARGAVEAAGIEPSSWRRPEAGGSRRGPPGASSKSGLRMATLDSAADSPDSLSSGNDVPGLEMSKIFMKG